MTKKKMKWAIVPLSIAFITLTSQVESGGGSGWTNNYTAVPGANTRVTTNVYTSGDESEYVSDIAMTVGTSGITKFLGTITVSGSLKYRYTKTYSSATTVTVTETQKQKWCPVRGQQQCGPNGTRSEHGAIGYWAV